MAYGTVLTAALSGAAVRQLQHWRTSRLGNGHVLVPEVSAERPLLYSFRDIVALRSCVYLRRESSLQQIRIALANMANLGYREHLSEYKLASDGSSIVLTTSDSDLPVDLVRRPGQHWMLPLSDVLGPFKNQRGVEVPDLFQPRAHVEVDQDRRAGFPVITGTRVPYDTVASLVRDGVAPRDVHQWYPSVTAAAARDAVSFADYVDSYREQPAALQRA